MEVKICGLTSLRDAEAVVAAEADYLGFVFYPRSPRAVTPEQVKAILGQLPVGIRAVGVFVNESRQHVEKIVRDCGLWGVQLHGDETPGDFAGFPCPVWRAVHWEGAVWKPDPAAWPVERFVVDAFAPVAYGGTGQVADWSAAARLAAGKKCMLAGGLTPANVREAVSRVNPMGVDVSSGVESQPGVKDHQLIDLFIREVLLADSGKRMT